MIFSVLGDNDARGAGERNLIGLVRLLPSVALPKGKVAYSTWLPSTELSGAGFPDPDCGSLTQAIPVTRVSFGERRVGINQAQQAPPVHSSTAAMHLPWFD